MISRLDAVLFDLDGTIIDSEPLWQEAMMTLLHELGIPLSSKDREHISTLIYGVTIFHACATVKELLHMQQPIEALIQKAQAILIALYHKKLHFIPGFISFYESVIEKDLKTALVTNSDRAILDAVSKILNLGRYFGKNIFSVSNVAAGKPDPMLYRYALEKIDVSAEYALALEDSAVGIEAARKAGIVCIGILNGHNDAQIIHADYIAQNFEEVRTLIDREFGLSH